MRSTCLAQAKNAFELLSKLPAHGVGAKLSRTAWTDDCYWTISKVKLALDGKHGQAWGVLTWRGEARRPEAPTQVAGPLKHVWRTLDDGSSASQQPWQSLLGGALRQARPARPAAVPDAAAADSQAADAGAQCAAI